MPQEDYHTLAGFVFGELGRAPDQGDELVWDGLRFGVVEVDGARIEKLDVEFLRAANDPAARSSPPDAFIYSAHPGTSASDRLRRADGSADLAADAWFPRPERLDRGVETLPGVGPAGEEAGQARAAHDRRPARAPALPLRGGGARGADRRPPRGRGGGRDRRRGREDVGRRPRRRLAIVQARIADESGEITAVWFNQAWLADKLKPGTHVRLRGQLRRNEFAVRSYDLNGASATADFAPVYPASEEVTVKLRELAGKALAHARDFPTTCPLPQGSRRMPPLRRTRCRRCIGPGRGTKPSGAAAGSPSTSSSCSRWASPGGGAAARRSGHRRSASRASSWPRYRELLPFELTPHQERAIEEIDADLAKPTPMERLLQGEVGSGKTVVALYALLRAVEAGKKGALMAPTETLAEQHFLTLEEPCRELGVEVALLTRSVKDDPAGAQILVGTHALIQEGVDLDEVAVAVVDEQHRFGGGVEQRRAITGGDAARPAHDGDADPPHARAHGLRRPLRERDREAAGEPQAGQDGLGDGGPLERGVQAGCGSTSTTAARRTSSAR